MSFQNLDKIRKMEKILKINAYTLSTSSRRFMTINVMVSEWLAVIYHLPLFNKSDTCMPTNKGR